MLYGKPLDDFKYSDTATCDLCARERHKNDLTIYDGKVRCRNVEDCWNVRLLDRAARDLKVGTKVWRAHRDTVQAGEVKRIERDPCDSNFSGDPSGGLLWYVAEFPDHSWERQSHQWLFFADERAAWARVAELARREAEELRHRAERQDAIARAAAERAGLGGSG